MFYINLNIKILLLQNNIDKFNDWIFVFILLYIYNYSLINLCIYLDMILYLYSYWLLCIYFDFSDIIIILIFIFYFHFCYYNYIFILYVNVFIFQRMMKENFIDNLNMQFLLNFIYFFSRLWGNRAGGRNMSQSSLSELNYLVSS